MERMAEAPDDQELKLSNVRVRTILVRGHDAAARELRNWAIWGNRGGEL
jgi:hypothetical protein